MFLVTKKGFHKALNSLWNHGELKKKKKKSPWIRNSQFYGYNKAKNGHKEKQSLQHKFHETQSFSCASISKFHFFWLI